MGQMSKDRVKADVTAVFKKGKEDLENYKLVSHTSIPRKVMKQLILETIFRQMKDKNTTRSSHHMASPRGSQQLINLVSLRQNDW